MRPSSVLCTRSPTPAIVLITAHHAAPVPAHHETSKHDSPNKTKVKEKIKQNYPGFEFKSRQVNDSSQSKQEIDHLVSQKSRAIPLLGKVEKFPIFAVFRASSISVGMKAQTSNRSATLICPEN
jgi:hypothetical protein